MYAVNCCNTAHLPQKGPLCRGPVQGVPRAFTSLPHRSVLSKRAQRRSMPQCVTTGTIQESANLAVQQDVGQRRTGMQHFALEGPVFAIVTPFTPGSLKFDDDAFVKYLEYLWSHGAKNIIVNGTTGEFPSMTLEERMHITRLARAHWPGVIINNVSATAVPDAQRLLEHSRQHVKTAEGGEAAVNAALLLPPYYFASAPEPGLERWLRLVLEEARLPVYLYNFPQHTGNLISPGLFARLAHDFPLVRGIKNSFGDVALCKEFKAAMPDRQVYVGFDSLALEGLEAGLDGAVGIGGPAAVMKALLGATAAHARGDADAARECRSEIAAWAEKQREVGVVDVPAAKAALSAAIEDFPAGVRAPLLCAVSKQRDALASFFAP